MRNKYDALRESHDKLRRSKEECAARQSEASAASAASRIETDTLLAALNMLQWQNEESDVRIRRLRAECCRDNACHRCNIDNQARIAERDQECAQLRENGSSWRRVYYELREAYEFRRAHYDNLMAECTALEEERDFWKMRSGSLVRPYPSPRSGDHQDPALDPYVTLRGRASSWSWP